MPRQGHEAFARAFYAAFPDIRHHIEDVFADGDRVAVRFVLHGTHTGPFFGIPPTRSCGGRRRERADAGRRRPGVGLAGIFDEAGLLRQLGALPS